MTTGITHFKDNQFVLIHKVVDGSLCQKYLWHFGIFAFWHFGILAFWHFGILAFWHFGILAFWHFAKNTYGILAFFPI
jgi:hypothetical protein